MSPVGPTIHSLQVPVRENQSTNNESSIAGKKRGINRFCFAADLDTTKVLSGMPNPSVR
jgi:hypothetical protein